MAPKSSEGLGMICSFQAISACRVDMKPMALPKVASRSSVDASGLYWSSLDLSMPFGRGPGGLPRSR
eukprot:10641046-Alexandrium_andersonii.AAC.1